jgi:AcrR family transcriptional regulator
MLTVLTLVVFMDQDYGMRSVKTRLILAGLNEIEEYGIKNFSLRRVALGAQVSCAAPYRHFKDKDDFIKEIIKYIGSQWQILFDEIKSSHQNDLKTIIKNSSISYVRFWLGNTNFRTILMSSPSATTLIGFDSGLEELMDKYFNHEAFAKRKFFIIRSLVYGAILLSGFNDPEQILNGLSIALDKEI